MNLIIIVLSGVLIVFAVLILLVVLKLRNLQEERDNAELKLKERTFQLQEEQARFHASVTNLPLGYLMTTVGGTIFTLNDTFKKIFGIEHSIVTVGEIDKLYPPLNLTNHLRICIEDNKKIIVESGFGQKYLHIFISPITLEEQKIIGAVMLFEDITDSVVLERSKDEFFSIASHELRTPLTAIRGNTALLKQYYSDKFNDQNFSEMVGDIHDSSVHLIQIVNDFLSVSRLEQGRIKFDMAKIDLVREIFKVVEGLKNEAAAKSIYLKFDNNNPVWVMADKVKLKEVLINLIGNSIKFTEKGGVSINIEINNDFQKVKVAVSDTGIGIAEEQRSLLFRKFQQAGQNTITRDATRGTGLGLYISKLLVEGMGGEIRLENSEAGKGSTFSFTLKDVKV